jgi:hypothetical protein
MDITQVIAQLLSWEKAVKEAKENNMAINELMDKLRKLDKGTVSQDGKGSRG